MKLNVPDAMNNIFHANIPQSKPSFTDDLQADWFSGSSDICNKAKKAKAKDLAFVMTRENENQKIRRIVPSIQRKQQQDICLLFKPLQMTLIHSTT